MKEELKRATSEK